MGFQFTPTWVVQNVGVVDAYFSGTSAKVETITYEQLWEYNFYVVYEILFIQISHSKVYLFCIYLLEAANVSLVI